MDLVLSKKDMTTELDIEHHELKIYVLTIAKLINDHEDLTKHKSSDETSTTYVGTFKTIMYNNVMLIRYKTF